MDQYTSWLLPIHSYTGDIWIPADTHPPIFLSYSWILQSSETTCRCLLILAASTHWLLWCVRQKVPHLSDTMSLGFWAALNMLCYRGSSWAAARLQVLLWEGLRGWGYRTFGENPLVLQWEYRFFQHDVTYSGLALKGKTFHIGELFQKTSWQVLELAMKYLMESKGHFSQGFFYW